MDKHFSAKLADLGTSRAVQPEGMTVGVGSPLWMAPEVFTTSSYSLPSDVYSFGVVAYEILNEALPEFNPQQRRSIIPEGTKGYEFVKLCTDENPDKRPTVTQIIEIVTQIISSYTVKVAKKVIEKTNSSKKSVIQLPPESDITQWYSILVGYNKNTFDRLLEEN